MATSLTQSLVQADVLARIAGDVRAVTGSGLDDAARSNFAQRLATIGVDVRVHAESLTRTGGVAFVALDAGGRSLLLQVDGAAGAGGATGAEGAPR